MKAYAPRLRRPESPSDIAHDSIAAVFAEFVAGRSARTVRADRLAVDENQSVPFIGIRIPLRTVMPVSTAWTVSRADMGR